MSARNGPIGEGQSYLYSVPYDGTSSNGAQYSKDTTAAMDYF
jgi:hypothetical protein